MGNRTGCTFDFVAVNWYSNIYARASYFEFFINQTREVVGDLPIWVTKFGITDDDPYTDQQLQEFLGQVMPWMDQTDYVDRYAYIFHGFLGNFDQRGWYWVVWNRQCLQQLHKLHDTAIAGLGKAPNRV